MSRKLSELFPRAKTYVIIEPWAGPDGWPCLRVYALGDGYDQFDEYSEHKSKTAALYAAQNLSRKIGAPVFDLSDGEWNDE